MRFAVGIVAEHWERAFARETINRLRAGPYCDCVMVPDFLLPLEDRTDSGLPVVPVASGSGFISAAQVATAIEAAAGTSPLLLISAGALPCNAACDRHAEASARPPLRWQGPTEAFPSFAHNLSQPIHRPPAQPRHEHRRVGKLDVWQIDTGEHYFQAVGALSAMPSVFSQYGRDAPIFVYNTNNFFEFAPGAQEDYAFLGSGLLGLRMAAESASGNGTRLLIFDINPGALTWTEYVLSNACRFATLPSLIDAFRASHPAIPIRPIAPHEHENADGQECWYRDRRESLISLSKLERIFIDVDIFTNPQPLFRQLRPGRKTMVMYLDLFVPWHVADPSPWVCVMPGISRSFEAAVRAILGTDVCFLPGPNRSPLQIDPRSPFLQSGKEMALCT